MPKILPPKIVKKEVDGNHYYWVDGKYFPGVTSIIEQGAPMGWQLKQYFIRNSADEIRRKQEESLEFGSRVHDAIERLLMGEKLSLIEEFPTLKGKKTMMSFHDWFHALRPRDYVAEHVIASVSMRYAGTLDFAGWVKPEKIKKVLGREAAKNFESDKEEEFWIVDFKTSRGIYLGYKLQIMAYKKAYEEMYGKKVDRTGILRVGTTHKKGYEFVEVKEEDVNFEDFHRIYETYLLVNDGKIPDPPVIDVYPEFLQIVTKEKEK